MDLKSLINKIGIKQQEKENKALGTYIENSSQNKEKLETLLSEFKKIISDKAAPTLWMSIGIDGYYDYISKKINNFDFDIKNVNLLTNDMSLYDTIRSDDRENTEFGLFLSVLINKNLKAGEKVQITTSIPVDYLFYKLENVEAHVNIAGRYLGSEAKNSKIYADEAGDGAGESMENCELHVKKAGEDLGDDAKNSKIYADEAGDGAGKYMKKCELHIRKAYNYLGNSAKNSKIYADEAGDNTGESMERCELHVKTADDSLGSRAKNSKIYADKAGDNTGEFMENCKLYVKEVYYNLGDSAKNSKIYADDLEGNLAGNILKGNNTVYLGKESYEKFLGYHGKVEIWKKKT